MGRRERIDAEAARELLGILQHHAETEPESNREAALWFAIQRRIMGRPCRCESESDARHEACRRHGERATRLAELHAHLVTHPEDTTAHHQREALLEEIGEEAEAEILEKEKQIALGQRKNLWTIG